MKNILITILFIAHSIAAFSQKTHAFDYDKGDKLPDLPIGNVIDGTGKVTYSYQGKTKFSQHKEKLIILDFWQTYCIPCIEKFPDMSRIQEKYKGQVQVFLVNTMESIPEIRKWLSVRKAARLLPTNMPVLGDAKHLLKYFPGRGATGYHVWIKPDGTVIFRGISGNTTDKKIDQFLKTGEVEYVRDNALRYDHRKPFFDLQPKSLSEKVLMSSQIGRFDDSRADPYGGSGAKDIVDSIRGTRRNTYPNYSILNLYRMAFEGLVKTDPNIVFGDPLVLDVPDTSEITANPYILGRKETDEDYRRVGFTYEQILPDKFDETKRKQLMLEDLNRYFGLEKNIEGCIERRKIKVLAISKVEGMERFPPSVYGIEQSGSSALKQGNGSDIPYTSYKRLPIVEIFKQYFQRTKAQFLRGKIVVDNTNSKDSIDIQLPPVATIESLRDLNKILEKSGMIIKDEEVELEIGMLRKR